MRRLSLNIDVRCKSVVSVDIDEYDAFRILVKTLEMDFLLNGNYKYHIGSDYDGMYVYQIINGHNERVDDRGELFKALTEVAKCIFPNTSYR